MYDHAVHRRGRSERALKPGVTGIRRVIVIVLFEAQLIHWLMPRDTSDFSTRWILACCAGTCVVAVIAAIELQRVEQGRLFLCSLPWEALPSDVEIADAHDSARENTLSGVAAVFLIGFLLATIGPSSIANVRESRIANRKIHFCFWAAVTGDLLTTILFFHQSGIENELHPGIRLFGYAYGRTIGPLLGKVVQAVGVVFLAALLKRQGRWLLILVTIFYSAAAVYNFSQSH